VFEPQRRIGELLQEEVVEHRLEPVQYRIEHLHNNRKKKKK
jgi:hypothetical protein